MMTKGRSYLTKNLANPQTIKHKTPSHRNLKTTGKDPAAKLNMLFPMDTSILEEVSLQFPSTMTWFGSSYTKLKPQFTISPAPSPTSNLIEASVGTQL